MRRKANSFRVFLVIVAFAALLVGAAGCQSTGSETYRGSDGHAGHNH